MGLESLVDSPAYVVYGVAGPEARGAVVLVVVGKSPVGAWPATLASEGRQIVGE